MLGRLSTTTLKRRTQYSLPRLTYPHHYVVHFSSDNNPPAENKSWLDRLIGFIAQNKESTRIYNAENLFRSCANQADKKAWFHRGRISKEFLPRHALLMTHIWMCHKRLSSNSLSLLYSDEEWKNIQIKQNNLLEKNNENNQIKEEGEVFVLNKDYHLYQEDLFDKLWEDTTVRVRALGVKELMVNKHVVDVQKQSFPILLSYDQIFTRETFDDRQDALGAAVWRYLWLGNEKLTAEHCMVMVGYIHDSMKMLYDLDEEHVMEGRIPWEQVPSWKGIKSVVVSSKQDDTQGRSDIEEDELKDDGDEEEEEEEGDWREALDVTGKKYYWNVVTRESSWEKPKK